MILLKNLKIGDVIPLEEPTGTAKITGKRKSPLFRASGGCWSLDLKILSGPHMGKLMQDQHYPGDMEIEAL